MSMSQQESVACPSCAETFDVTVWASLNSNMDPDAAEQLRTGRLFEAVCPHCGETFQLNYPILFHDMTQGVMVQYTASEEEEVIKRYLAGFKEQQEMFSKLSMPIKRQYRIVARKPDLFEKAVIFNAGLDDRIVEIMKVFAVGQISDQLGDSMPDQVFYFREPNAEGFMLLRQTENGMEQIGHIPFSRAIYDWVKQGFKHEEDAGCFISTSWASWYLEKHQQDFAGE